MCFDGKYLPKPYYSNHPTLLGNISTRINACVKYTQEQSIINNPQSRSHLFNKNFFSFHSLSFLQKILHKAANVAKSRFLHSSEHFAATTKLSQF